MIVPAISPPMVVAPVVTVATPEVPEVDPELVPDESPELVPEESPELVPEVVADVVPEDEPEEEPDVVPEDEPEEEPELDPELPDARAIFGTKVEREKPIRAMVAVVLLGFRGMGVSCVDV